MEEEAEARKSDAALLPIGPSHCRRYSSLSKCPDSEPFSSSSSFSHPLPVGVCDSIYHCSSESSFFPRSFVRSFRGDCWRGARWEWKQRQKRCTSLEQRGRRRGGVVLLRSSRPQHWAAASALPTLPSLSLPLDPFLQLMSSFSLALSRREKEKWAIHHRQNECL